MNIFDLILYKPLFNTLLMIYKILGLVSVGWAVIVFSLIIRFILWPLFQRTIRYQVLVQKIQPELREVQKKFSKDKNFEAQTKATMEVYKKYNLHPLSGLLLIFLQLPIFWALAGAFYNFKEHLTTWPYAFLKINPAAVNLTFLGIDLSTASLVLIFLSVLAQTLQSYFVSNKQQRKSPWFYLVPLISIFILWKVLAKLPSVFFLYWLVISLVSIFQQKLVVDKLDKKENQGSLVNPSPY